MLRNIQRAIRPLPHTTLRSAAFQPPLRCLTFSTSGTVPRGGAPKPCRGHLCARRYSTTPPGQSSEAQDESKLPWIDNLESVSRAPWLSATPKKQEHILKRGYIFIFHIIVYLARPMSKDPKESRVASKNFLILFTSVPVRPDTEIGRARYAIAVLTKQLTKDLAGIPKSSPLRKEHPSVFASVNELVTPCDIYLENLQQNKPPADGEIVELGKWADFWLKVQPHLLALGDALEKAGYGLGQELSRAAAEEEKGQAK